MLNIEPSKRPSCGQLIESNLFQYYADKLAGLEMVDDNFLKTIETGKLASTTSTLLNTIYVPKDLKQLSGFLPKRNYDTDKRNKKRKESNKRFESSPSHTMNKKQSNFSVNTVNTKEANSQNQSRKNSEKNLNAAVP